MCWRSGRRWLFGCQAQAGPAPAGLQLINEVVPLVSSGKVYVAGGDVSLGPAWLYQVVLLLSDWGRGGRPSSLWLSREAGAGGTGYGPCGDKSQLVICSPVRDRLSLLSQHNREMSPVKLSPGPDLQVHLQNKNRISGKLIPTVFFSWRCTSNNLQLIWKQEKKRSDIIVNFLPGLPLIVLSLPSLCFFLYPPDYRAREGANLSWVAQCWQIILAVSSPKTRKYWKGWEGTLWAVVCLLDMLDFVCWWYWLTFTSQWPTLTSHQEPASIKSPSASEYLIMSTFWTIFFDILDIFIQTLSWANVFNL